MRTASDPLSATFFALADPTRRAILSRLAEGPATVKGPAAPFEMSGPLVSKHLRVLENVGLIQRGREAQWRPRTLDAAPLAEVVKWAGDFRRFWDASYARLDSYLHHLKTQESSTDQRDVDGRDRLHHADGPRSEDGPCRGCAASCRFRRLDQPDPRSKWGPEWPETVNTGRGAHPAASGGQLPSSRRTTISWPTWYAV